MVKQFGYKRVSTGSQTTERQLADLKLKPKDIFEDKISGKNKDRPQLEALLKAMREGDVIHVHSIDRLARNMGDLLSLVEQINGAGVTIQFHKESLTFTGEPNPMQELQLNMMGAFAQFERSLINERSAEGRAIAKAKGVQFGRKPTLTKKEKAKVLAAVNRGQKVRNIALDFDITRAMVYRIIEANKTTAPA